MVAVLQKHVPALRFRDEQGKDYLDWEEKTLGDISEVKRGASPRPISSPRWFSEDSNIGWVRISDVTNSYKYLIRTTQYLSNEGVKKSRFIPKGNMIMSICATIGKPIYTGFDVCIHDGFVVFEELKTNKGYLYYFLEKVQKRWYRYGQPGTQVNLNSSIVSNEKINIPEEPEQQKIATFLSSVDTKIEQLNKKKSLLEQYKKGLMQKLFSQEIRFKDEQGEEYPDWENFKLGFVAECLDNKRVPLNETERSKRKGNIPYWGANGILDFVDDYIFDETIVLLAEDGGYFDEFYSRPIASISYGKSWVNNHAHVLRAKKKASINEYLYYSLVHKNILGYVNGGTRAKLNKSSMLKIPLSIPSLEEQQKIAAFLSAIDKKIEFVTEQIKQAQTFKKGLLQQMFI